MRPKTPDVFCESNPFGKSPPQQKNSKKLHVFPACGHLLSLLVFFWGLEIEFKSYWVP